MTLERPQNFNLQSLSNGNSAALAQHLADIEAYFIAPLDNKYMERFDAAQLASGQIRIAPWGARPGLLFDRVLTTVEGKLFTDKADRALYFDMSNDGHLVGVARESQALLLNPCLGSDTIGYYPVPSPRDLQECLTNLLYVIPEKQELHDFIVLHEWAHDQMFGVA